MNKNHKKITAMLLAVSAVSASFTVFADDETILTNSIPEIAEEISEMPEPSENTPPDMSVWNIDDIGVQLLSVDPAIVDTGKCGDNLTWTLDSEGKLTISGTGDMYDYDWTYIDDSYITTALWGKYANSIKKLVLDNGITSIGNAAFYSCRGLTGDLVIPDSVTSIGDNAFKYCSGLTGDLIIPDSVTSIGDGAFEYCTGLTGDLVIPDSVISIGVAAFSKCNGLTGDLVIPDSVISIGSWAFESCESLTGELVIPDSVTSIGDSTFSNCSGLTGNLVIPDSVTSIGNTAFYSCRGFTGDLVIPDSVTSIGDNAFTYCNGLTGDLVIPDSVINIGVAAFEGCFGINGNLIISDGITSIGGHTFKDNYRLTGTLVIPDSVTSIGNYAFYGCWSLTGDLVIPDSVTEINNNAFEGCSCISDMYIPRTEDSIGTGNFPNRVHWAYDLSECTAVINDFTCTGSAIVPTEADIMVTSPNGKTLYYGTDYVIDRVSNNVNVGTSTARIVPPEGGISTKSQDIPFNIVGIDLSDAEVTFPDNITWSGAPVEPEPTVVVNGKTLTKDVDYTITYGNNVFTADDFSTKDTTHTATATITGIGSYRGSLIKEFEVEGYKPDGWDSVDIERELSVSATIDGTFVYNGAEHTPTPKLVYHFVNPTTNVAIDYDMVKGEDFEIVSYSNNVNAGTAKIVVEGIGAFENTRTITFNISPCELSATTIADIPSYEYCKKDICPDVEIKVGDTVMTNGIDYELTYENNRNRGTATVTITGKGNLTGVTTKNFEITPRDGSKFVYIIWL